MQIKGVKFCSPADHAALFTATLSHTLGKRLLLPLNHTFPVLDSPLLHHLCLRPLLHFPKNLFLLWHLLIPLFPTVSSISVLLQLPPAPPSSLPPLFRTSRLCLLSFSVSWPFAFDPQVHSVSHVHAAGGGVLLSVTNSGGQLDTSWWNTLKVLVACVLGEKSSLISSRRHPTASLKLF